MACNQTISGLTRGCETSMGGVKSILIAAYVDNAYTASVTTGGVETSVTAVTTGATWYKYDIRKNTASFTSTANLDDANGVNFISTELNLIFTRMETVKRMEMAALVLGDFMAIVTDANGKHWAFGKDNPMIASAATGESGTQKTDGNKYSITLKDESLSWPLEVVDSAMPTPAND